MKKTMKGFMMWDWTNGRPFFDSPFEVILYMKDDTDFNKQSLEDWMEETGYNGLPVEITVTEEGQRLLEEEERIRKEKSM